MTIKKSGNTFKVETTELTFLASEKGVDDGIDSSSRRTKGKIAFESSNLVSAVLDSPEVVFVKSEKDRKFLKSLRARRRKQTIYSESPCSAMLSEGIVISNSTM